MFYCAETVFDFWLVEYLHLVIRHFLTFRGKHDSHPVLFVDFIRIH